MLETVGAEPASCGQTTADSDGRLLGHVIAQMGRLSGTRAPNLPKSARVTLPARLWGSPRVRNTLLYRRRRQE
jgi:hypothetical protein